MPYVPGKAIILSRLPDQQWFTPAEAAAHSGWSQTFITARIRSGELAAQQFQKSREKRPDRPGTHLTYKIHIDDLALFIMVNGSGRFSEEKPFRDVALIVRSWPLWMIKELGKVIDRTLTAHAENQAAHGTRSGTEQAATPAAAAHCPNNSAA